MSKYDPVVLLKKDCIICGKEFETVCKQRRMCSNDCRNLLIRVKANVKTEFARTPEELELKKKLIANGVIKPKRKYDRL
jgi:predicted nucleic acid-binding Zn ribbon protein